MESYYLGLVARASDVNLVSDGAYGTRRRMFVVIMYFRLGFLAFCAHLGPSPDGGDAQISN